MWELYLCFGITWAGCGGIAITPYQSKAECFEALAAMRVQENGQSITNGNGRQLVAYCRPQTVVPKKAE